MEMTRTMNTTEQLRLKLIRKVMLTVFGCIAGTLAVTLLPLLYLMPVRSEAFTGSPPPTAPATPFLALIPLLGLLLIAGFVAYEAYDLIKLIPRYRESKQNDDTLFP